MRLLITGACGFVGSELALALQENLSGAQITGLDNLSRRGIKVLHGDIRQAADLEGIGPFNWLIDEAVLEEIANFAEASPNWIALSA
jgi:CDP-paratose 2-epimerase